MLAHGARWVHSPRQQWAMPMFAALAVFACLAGLSPTAAAQPQPEATAPLEWKSLERGVLRNHVQLTKREEFVKAGEAYFSPDGNWIIFQAVPVPEEGKEASPFYAMYVAKLKRDRFTGLVTGVETPIRVSPEGSANTCGWFAPADPKSPMTFEVLFGSTVQPPRDEAKSGFQVGTRKYVWMFPDEMEIVTARIGQQLAVDQSPDGKRTEVVTYKASDAKPLFTRPNYDAEGSWSPDGRFVLYAHIEDRKEGQKPDANLYIYDTQTKKQHALVTAKGYDGGPFFSPDGKSICYHSDRKGNDLLQLFVADLKLKDGVPVGITREYQLTDNEHVNWCPYWHPSGKYLVYGTSEVSHGNYEVFAIECDMDALRRGRDPKSLKHVRITQASGADILPSFSPDGNLMMWTSQRGPKIQSEEKASSQLWIAEWVGNPLAAEKAKP